MSDQEPRTPYRRFDGEEVDLADPRISPDLQARAEIIEEAQQKQGSTLTPVQAQTVKDARRQRQAICSHVKEKSRGPSEDGQGVKIEMVCRNCKKTFFVADL